MLPQLDSSSDGDGLEDPGDHDGGHDVGRQVCELGVLGEEQQVGLGGQPLADGVVGEAAQAEGDDVLGLVAGIAEAPVELEGGGGPGGLHLSRDQVLTAVRYESAHVAADLPPAVR